MIACIAPPGTVFGHTATVEKTPSLRPLADALVLCALFNSFSFDWLVRQKAATHLSLYILEALPVPAFTDAATQYLAHAALQLSCNHAGQGHTPNRVDPDLRAEIDAVVADAYGLDREQYEHLLGGFSHRSWPDGAQRCLVAFDKVKAAGSIESWKSNELCREVSA